MLASIAEELGVAAGCSHLRSISILEPHTLNPPTLLVLVQTFEIVFSQYHRHPEYGSLAPGDTACNADSAGLLKRHPVTASAFHLIGKETERGWEQADHISTLLPTPIRYQRNTGAAPNC